VKGEHSEVLATLIAAAQKEGTINTIALPPTWANYGEIMKTFQKKYKLKLTDAIPDGTSAQENTAISSNKGSKRAPDVVDRVARNGDEKSRRRDTPPRFGGNRSGR